MAQDTRADEHDRAMEALIEERRQQALAMIAKMREEPCPEDAAGKPWLNGERGNG